MEITVIGSGTCVPSLRRASPCILVDTGSAKILLDTGPGTIRQLLKANITIHAIDIIIYSHFHADHTADLIPFIFASKYSPGIVRNNELTIIGAPGLKELYQHLTRAYGKWAIPEHFAINWIEVGKKPIHFPSFVLETAPARHIESSLGIRIADARGKSLVYSGDSEYCTTLVDLARNTDLLILECAFPEHLAGTGHLIPSLAGKMARESQCKRLLLTHFYPPCDEHDLLTPLHEEFSGEVILAEDLMKLSV